MVDGGELAEALDDAAEAEGATPLTQPVSGGSAQVAPATSGANERLEQRRVARPASRRATARRRTKPAASIASIVPSARAGDDATGPRRARSTAWWWKELTAIARVAEHAGQARARRDLDLVRRAAVASSVWRWPGDVLVQRAAAGDVERLGAAADRRGSACRARARRGRARARTRRGWARSGRAPRGASARRRRRGRGPGRRTGRCRRGGREQRPRSVAAAAAARPASRRPRRACADTSCRAPSRGAAARRGGACVASALAPQLRGGDADERPHCRYRPSVQMHSPWSKRSA